MNAFIKEHTVPLIGAAALHVLVLAGAIALTLFTVAPHLTPPAAIEAYIASKPSLKPVAPPPPAPAAEPTPATPPPVDAREQAEADRQAEHRAEEIRAAESKAAAIKAQEAEDAHLRAVQAKTEQAEERHRAEVAATRRAQEEEAKRKAAAIEAQRRADEVKRKADAVANAKQKADAAERAKLESDLARQIAQEEHLEGVKNSPLQQQYVAAIQAAVERAWQRPPSAKPGLSCTVFVNQVPGGAVSNVRLGDCNGDAAVQESIRLAVLKAAPLPKPPDPSLFERNLRLEFAPQ